MANNYFYYVVDTKDENGLYFAYPARVHESNNLLSVIAGFKNIVTLHQCKTMKEAKRIADYWNECQKKNGRYLYQNNDVSENMLWEMYEEECNFAGTEATESGFVEFRAKRNL